MIRSELVPRVYFDEQVSLLDERHSIVLRGRALNLSTAGMFVCGECSIEHTTPLDVRFELPGGGAVEARVSVVRAIGDDDPFEPAGLALRFETMTGDCAARLERFIAGMLQPASGHRICLDLDELGSTVSATAHSSWGNVLAVDAELPFLRVGSAVHLSSTMPTESRNRGAVRWVSVHIDPDTGIPRLNIGIQLDDASSANPAQASEGSDILHDEELDPIYTTDFVQHVRSRELELSPLIDRAVTS